MAVSHIHAVLPCDIHKLWHVMTDVEHQTWRSDISRTELLRDKQFVEYTKAGYPTSFTITAMEPCRRWEFDMENSSMTGHWTGVLTPLGGQTQLDFTEDVTAKKWWMKPFVRGYLKKQQALYLSDLSAALNDPQ